MRKDEAFEVASLAALIGSQLKTLDSMTIERTNNPANKININDFIAPLKNPTATVRSKSYLTEAPSHLSPALPEHIIQNMVPYEPSFVPNNADSIASVNTDNSLKTVHTADLNNRATLAAAVAPVVTDVKNNIAKTEKILFTRSDIDSIRNSLKNIDKTLSGILEYMKNNKSS